MASMPTLDWIYHCHTIRILNLCSNHEPQESDVMYQEFIATTIRRKTRLTSDWWLGFNEISIFNIHGYFRYFSLLRESRTNHVKNQIDFLKFNGVAINKKFITNTANKKKREEWLVHIHRLDLDNNLYWLEKRDHNLYWLVHIHWLDLDNGEWFFFCWI